MEQIILYINHIVSSDWNYILIGFSLQQCVSIVCKIITGKSGQKEGIHEMVLIL